MRVSLLLVGVSLLSVMSAFGMNGLLRRVSLIMLRGCVHCNDGKGNGPRRTADKVKREDKRFALMHIIVRERGGGKGRCDGGLAFAVKSWGLCLRQGDVRSSFGRQVMRNRVVNIGTRGRNILNKGSL